MEKLIELLNEYHFFNTDCINYVLDEEENRIYLKEEFDGFYHEQRINAERIISKKFGFIKWLVENDKIDTDIVYEKGFLAKTYDKDEVGEYFEPYEEILMLLAIQNEPIEFLISILK